MKFLVVGALMLAMVPWASSQTSNQKVPAPSDEQELKRLEDEWLNTYLRGDKTTFDRIVADDFTGTDESAVLRNKVQERELVQAPHAGSKSVSHQ